MLKCEGRENESPRKKLKVNKQKLAKKRRDLGQNYVSPKQEGLKSQPLTIFFKTSHLQNEYKSFKLKRQLLNLQGLSLQALNPASRKITNDKYLNLKSLCEGDTPLIRLEEHKNFYLNIPHEWKHFLSRKSSIFFPNIKSIYYFYWLLFSVVKKMG